MRVTSLGSGSSGNALLIEAGPQRRTKLLIDAGFSGRILCQRLQQAGVAPAQLQGICVTHEHADHIGGLPWLTKRYAVPVIADPRTLAALERQLANGYAYSDNLPARLGMRWTMQNHFFMPTMAMPKSESKTQTWGRSCRWTPVLAASSAILK